MSRMLGTVSMGVRAPIIRKGDNLVLTGGQINGKPGHTNMIKLETVK